MRRSLQTCSLAVDLSSHRTVRREVWDEDYNEKHVNNKITGAVSPLIRYMALAMPQTTRLVCPRWDITNGGMLAITPGISRRGTGLFIDLKCEDRDTLKYTNILYRIHLCRALVIFVNGEIASFY